MIKVSCHPCKQKKNPKLLYLNIYLHVLHVRIRIFIVYGSPHPMTETSFNSSYCRSQHGYLIEVIFFISTVTVIFLSLLRGGNGIRLATDPQSSSLNTADTCTFVNVYYKYFENSGFYSSKAVFFSVVCTP